MTQMIDNDMWK